MRTIRFTILVVIFLCHLHQFIGSHFGFCLWFHDSSVTKGINNRATSKNWPHQNNLHFIRHVIKFGAAFSQVFDLRSDFLLNKIFG